MASGETVFKFRAPHGTPPGTLGASLDWVPGASTPAENMPVYDFDAAADTYMDFFDTMPENYGGGGLTIDIEVSASVATSSNFRLAIAFRLRDTTDDWDTTAHTYVYNEVSVAVPGTVGLSVVGEITFTNGADMDSVIAGSQYVLRIYRNQGHGDDLATGDMQLERIHGKET